MFQMFDTIQLDDAAQVRRTSDGYLVAMPRVARTGIQLYRGSEVGKPEMPVVKVMRTEEEVFKTDAMASLAYKPITDDHPKEMVNDTNWKKYSIGSAGGEIAKDGQFIRVPMMLMDANAISRVLNGKAELSVGYSCSIDWTPGEFNGEKYDAVQRDIKANHIAVVDAARGGEKLRIGDAAEGRGVAVCFDAFQSALDCITKGNVKIDDVLTDGLPLAVVKDGHNGYPFGKDGFVYAKALRHSMVDAAVKGDSDVVSACTTLLAMIDKVHPGSQQTHTEKGTTKMSKTIVVDGITVETNDVGAQIIERHIKTLSDSAATLQKQLADLQAKYDADVKAKNEEIAKITTDKATAEAKVTTLESQIKDSAMTPAKLDQLVKDRSEIIGKAKSVLGDKLVIDGKTDGEIRRQVVDAKLGDAAKGWDDNQVKASFDTLTANVKASDSIDQVRQAFSAPSSHGSQTNDAAVSAYDKRNERLRDAWKGGSATKQ